MKLLQVTSDVYFVNKYSQSIFRAEDRFAGLQWFGVQRFTSPTRHVIFRCSFANISLITYSQIQVHLKSQFFKEGLRMCEFSRRNVVKSVLKVQFLHTKKFITWRSWLVLNPFRWPKFRFEVIYIFISHGWKPISISRSSKMQIYQVFLYRKFVTEVYLHHVQKIITWSIFIVSSWFHCQN